MSASTARARGQRRRHVRRRRVDRDGQVLIPYPLGWGGKRPGAGRKPAAERAQTPHRQRPQVSGRWPLHVTMRVVDGLPSLRKGRCMAALWQAFVAGKQRFGLRLVHFCVQRSHIHLIIEADDRRALLKGMRGLSIRVARRLNRALGRRETVIADRYHAEVLDSFPRIRHCIAYVMNNERRHCYQHGGWVKVAEYIDPCSSGLFFDGWRGAAPERPRGPDPPVVEPSSYALSTGWRRHGLVGLDEIPGVSAAPRRRGAKAPPPRRSP